MSTIEDAESSNTNIKADKLSLTKNVKLKKLYWRKYEEKILLSALYKYGHQDVNKISAFLPNKTERSIILYLRKHKLSAIKKIKHKTTIETNEALDKIHPWISFMNMFLDKKPNIHNNLIAYVLPLIERYGKHPLPEMCSGIDFRLAYKVLFSSLIQENFSNELNNETFSMLYASMCQLLGDVMNNGEGTEHILRKCLKRCMTSESTINENAVENDTLRLPEVNILNLLDKELDLLCKTKL